MNAYYLDEKIKIMNVFRIVTAIQIWYSSGIDAIPFRDRAETVFIKRPNDYLPFTKILSVNIDQIQDFVCPKREHFNLYLIPDSERIDFQACEIRLMYPVLHRCVYHRPSSFTLYYSTMTPSGWLEFERGAKYWIISSYCDIQIKIYVW